MNDVFRIFMSDYTRESNSRTHIMSEHIVNFVTGGKPLETLITYCSDYKIPYFRLNPSGIIVSSNELFFQILDGIDKKFPLVTKHFTKFIHPDYLKQIAPQIACDNIKEPSLIKTPFLFITPYSLEGIALNACSIGLSCGGKFQGSFVAFKKAESNYFSLS